MIMVKPQTCPAEHSFFTVKVNIGKYRVKDALTRRGSMIPAMNFISVRNALHLTSQCNIPKSSRQAGYVSRVLIGWKLRGYLVTGGGTGLAVIKP